MAITPERERITDIDYPGQLPRGHRGHQRAFGARACGAMRRGQCGPADRGHVARCATGAGELRGAIRTAGVTQPVARAVPAHRGRRGAGGVVRAAAAAEAGQLIRIVVHRRGRGPVRHPVPTVGGPAAAGDVRLGQPTLGVIRELRDELVVRIRPAQRTAAVVARQPDALLYEHFAIMPP